MKWVDLSHLMTIGMPVFPGTEPFVREKAAGISTHGYNELRFKLTGHIGTHIDCSAHVMNGGFNTGNTLLGHFAGDGIIVDCRGRGASLSADIFKKQANRIEKADFVLLYTGWDQYWGKDSYFGDPPVLDNEAAEYLSDFSLKGIGIDGPGFDRMDSTELPVHKILLGKGIVLVENLTNLKDLPDDHFMFFCFPLKIEHGDGSPVRAVAWIK